MLAASAEVAAEVAAVRSVAGAHRAQAGCWVARVALGKLDTPRTCTSGSLRPSCCCTKSSTPDTSCPPETGSHTPEEAATELAPQVKAVPLEVVVMVMVGVAAHLDRAEMEAATMEAAQLAEPVVPGRSHMPCTCIVGSSLPHYLRTS